MRRYKKLNYDPWQIEFLNTKGDKILCTGRQVGKSEICAKDAGDYAVEHPDMEPIVMIAPTERQARGLFQKTLAYITDTYPKLLIIKGKNKPTNTQICLTSGVKIFCLPVGKDGLGIRFLTIGRIYKDECSRIPEAVHEAVDPALLTTGGDEILLSTPFGAVGTFYETFINKDSVYDSFTRFSISSEKVIEERPICDTWTKIQREKALNKLAKAKKRWSTRRYAQEFLGEFMEDLHRWFSDEIIDEICVLERRETIQKGRDYAMGNDIARMGEDEGTFEILDYTNREAVEHVENIVTTKKKTNETEDRIVELSRLYDLRIIYIDAGSGTLGVSIFDHLIIRPETKHKIVAIDNKQRALDKDGKKKGLVKKNDLYDNLLAMMNRRQIKLLDDEDLKASLRSIQYEYVMKDGEETKLRIFGVYSHITEGLIRAAECVKDKRLSIWCR